MRKFLARKGRLDLRYTPQYFCRYGAFVRNIGIRNPDGPEQLIFDSYAVKRIYLRYAEKIFEELIRR
jgi:hypothetical protein